MGKVVKKVGKAIGSVFKAVGNFVGMLFTGPKVPKATANTSTETRLQASLVPEENFKVIFGETAAGTDMRFWETYGAGNNGHVQVFAAACHEITGYGNLYLDEKPVTFAGNDATGTFAGLLSRRQVLKGISGASIALGSGTRWTASSAMTGCAWYALIWNYNQEKLPNGIPSRVTLVVKGAKVYDPRRDSTRGGSGAHRADNPATWEYLPTDSNGQPIGRNNALQMLAYTLGIKALSPVTGQWELRAGRGADPADIDFDTFITAANACEIEGWYSDCILSTGDSHSTNEGILEAASGGRLSDTGGRFSYYVSTDDTANVAAFFNEGDIVGETDWEPAKAMSEQYNQLPGTFTDPTALFQTRPLPLCYSAEYYAIDGYKKRAEPEKLSSVQDPAQGQKLLRRKLNRSRYQGVFTATFNLRGLKVRDNSIVRLTFPQQGWVQKLFRVGQQGISKSGGIQLVLEEESPAIYLPGAVLAVLPPGAGFGGDTGDVVAVAGLKATPSGVISGPMARDAMIVEFNAVGQLVERTEGRYKKTGDASWTPLPPLRRDQVGWKVEPLLSNTSYTFEVRHITLWNVPSAWAPVVRSTDAVTINPAGQMVYSNGQTVDSLRPGEAGANITESRTSAAIYGQGWGATANQDQAGNDRLFGPNTNRVFFSNFEKDKTGWKELYDPNTLVGALSVGVYLGRRYLRQEVTYTGNNQQRSFGQDFSTYFFPVKGNERLSVQVGIETLGKSTAVVVLWFRDAQNTQSEAKNVFIVGPGSAFNSKIATFVNAPSFANQAYFEIYQESRTAGAGYGAVSIVEPMVASANDSQTIHPPFAYGPSAVPGSDPTGQNVSLGFIGQGWGATANENLVSNALSQMAGPNLVRLSRFQKGRMGHYGMWAGHNGAAVSAVFAEGSDNPAIEVYTASQLPAQHWAAVWHGYPSSSWNETFQIQGGRRYCVSERMAYSDGPWIVSPRLRFYDTANNYLGEGNIVVVDAQSLFNADYYAYSVIDAPLNAVKCWIESYVGSDRAGYTGAHRIRIDRPCLRQIPPTMLSFPGYVDGPNSAEGSDPTGSNTAAAIIGQTGWATSSEPLSKISKLKNNGRSTSSYQVSNGVLTGATLYRTPVYVLGSALVSGAARITIAASTLRGSGITVSYSAGTIDGCAFSTVYYIWIYDPDVIGGTVTYVATTDPNAYIDNPDYLFVGNITTVASGGGTPPPYVPPPYPPGYTECVAAEAWLPTNQQAREIKPGDRLLMLNERGDNMEVGECVSNKMALAPCMIFETVSGIKLTCSTTTPIIFKSEDGYGAKPAWECDGSEVVPVIDAKLGFRWEALACQPGHVGLKQVAHISANDGVYAAGDTKHGFIFTHNIRQDYYVKQ